MGGETLEAIAQQIESACNNGNPGKITSLIHELDEQYGLLKKELERFGKEVKEVPKVH